MTEIYSNRSNYYFGVGHFEVQVHEQEAYWNFGGNTFINGGTETMEDSEYWEGATKIDYQRFTYAETVIGDDAADDFIGSSHHPQGAWHVITSPNGSPEQITQTWTEEYDDYFVGRGGNDTLRGSTGNDTLIGGATEEYPISTVDPDDVEDNDILRGEEGDDSIVGGRGNDVLYSGPLTDGASDTLEGGDGTDTFFLGDGEFRANETVVEGTGVDYGNLGLSLAGDISDLAFTLIPGASKVGKEIVPMFFDVVKSLFKTEDETVVAPDPASAGSAIITDFNPIEDVLVIPMADDGSIYLQGDNTADNLLKVFHDNAFVDLMATVQLSEDVRTLEGYGNSTKSLQTDWFNSLESQALILDATGVRDYKTLTDIPFPETDENGEEVNHIEGSNKFLILGAHSGAALTGDNNSNYLYGTLHNDIINGYESEDKAYTAGTDVMYGFAGNDIFRGGQGEDRIYGGDDIDTANYVHSTAGINANLGTVKSDDNGSYVEVSDGFGTSDKLYDVENIVGSSYDDTVSFNDENTTDDEAIEVKVYSLDGSQSPEGETNVLIGVENIIGSDNSNDSIKFNLDEITLVADNEGTTIVDSSTEQTYTVTDFENIILNPASGTVAVSGPVNLDNFTFENVTTIETGSVIGTTDADSLAGSSLNDFITGGGGADTLTGGEGADIFYFRSNDSAVDVVTDFNPSEDIILVDSGLYQIPEATAILYTQDGNNVTVSGAGTTFATIENVTVDEMNSYDTRYTTNSLPDWMTSQDIEVQIAPSEQQGYAALLPGVEAIANLPGEMIATGINKLTVNSGGWSSFDKYPRAVGDIDGDGDEDIVGFGYGKVFTALSNGDGTFANNLGVIQGDFTYSGNGSSLGKAWTSQDEYPRMLGDINGDGNDDIVGFHSNTVYSSLSNGDGTFADAETAYVGTGTPFTHATAWNTYDKNPRTLGDVNGDGFDDIIGFANSAVRVALANGDGTFGQVYTAFDSDFTYSDGYTSQNEYPRMVGDINGDGLDDIVGIDDNQVRLAWGQSDGTFYQPGFLSDNDQHNFLSEKQGWDNLEQSPRMLGDINADGKDDIIAYNSDDDTLMVSYATPDRIVNNAVQTKYGFNNPVELTGISGDTIADFIGSGEYSQNLYPLMTGDITGNGQEDIIGFGTSDVFASIW